MEIEENSLPALAQESIDIVKDATLIISDSCHSKGFRIWCFGGRGLHATIFTSVEGTCQMVKAPMVGLGFHDLGLRRASRRRDIFPGPDTSVGATSSTSSATVSSAATASSLASSATGTLRCLLSLEGGARDLHAVYLSREPGQ